MFAYRKCIDAYTTHTLRLPEGEQGQPAGTEVATVDGVTYVSLPDGVALPANQPDEIAASVKAVTLDAVLRETIANASPQVRMIRQHVAAQIAERYSVGDEIKLLRTAPSAEFEAYNAHAEACRAWGREQKAALGL